MSSEDLYGYSLGIEVFQAIEHMSKSGQKLTNRSIRDHLIEKKEIRVKGSPKENLTIRVSRYTAHLVDKGYLCRRERKNTKLNTIFYEFEIVTENRSS